MEPYFEHEHFMSEEKNIYDTLFDTLLHYSIEEFSEVKITYNDVISTFYKLLKAYSSITLSIIRRLGIWGLPPSDDVIKYLQYFTKKNKITEIIDYGTGRGLWARILNDVFGDKIKIIAYDNKLPLKNKNVNNQRAFYDICTIYDFKQLTKNSLLMLIWPQHNSSMAYKALQTCSSKYLLFYGSKEYNATDDFFKVLNENWTLEKRFDPLIILRDNLGLYSDKIYIYQRKN